MGNTAVFGHRYRYGIAIPMQNHTLMLQVTGILVPNFWSGEGSYDLVDSLTTHFRTTQSRPPPL